MLNLVLCRYFVELEPGGCQHVRSTLCAQIGANPPLRIVGIPGKGKFP